MRTKFISTNDPSRRLRCDDRRASIQGGRNIESAITPSRFGLKVSPQLLCGGVIWAQYRECRAPGRLSDTVDPTSSNQFCPDSHTRMRKNAAWCRYEPGIDPAGHLEELKSLALEQDRRRFEETLAQFQARLAGHEQRQNKRLALIAIGVTAVLGIVQLLAAVLSMTPESIGSPAVRWVADSISAVARWLFR